VYQKVYQNKSLWNEVKINGEEHYS
jgi:hypothetical protein